MRNVLVVVTVLIGCAHYSNGRSEPKYQRCSDPNEELRLDFMVKCEPTCDRYREDDCVPPSKTDNCLCKSGYYRNPWGACVPFSQCSNNPYPPNPNPYPATCWNEHEVYVANTNKECEPTCARREPGYCSPPYRGACFCRHGYYRDPWGNCISLYQCPAFPSTRPAIPSTLPAIPPSYLRN